MSKIAILINEAEIEEKAKAVAVDKKAKEEPTEKKAKEEPPTSYKSKTSFDSAVNIARQFVKNPAILAKLIDIAKSKNINTSPIDASFFDNYYDKFIQIWNKMGGRDGVKFTQGSNGSVDIKGASGAVYQVSLDEFNEFRNASRALKTLNDLRVYLSHQQEQEVPKKEEPKKEPDAVQQELEQYQQVYNRSVKITFKVLNDLEKYLTKYKEMFDNEGMSAYSSNINSLMGILGFIKSGLVAKFIDKNAGKDVESLSNELSKVVTQISGAATEVIKNSPLASQINDEELGNNAEEPTLEQPQDVTQYATLEKNTTPPPAPETPPVPLKQPVQEPQAVTNQEQPVQEPQNNSQTIPQSSAEEMGGEVSSIPKNSLVRGFVDGNIGTSTYGQTIENIIKTLNSNSEESTEIKNDLSNYIISNKVIQKLDKYLYASIGNRISPNEILKRYLNRKSQTIAIMKYISPKVLKSLQDSSENKISVSISQYFNDVEDANSIYNKNYDNLTEEQVKINDKLNEEYRKLLLQQTQAVNEQLIRDFIRNTLKDIL